MPWTEILHVSLEGLRAHKMRTLLTALGIIFGVGAVIAMLSIGEGARNEAMRKYASLGVENILVRGAERSAKELDTDRARFSRGLAGRDVATLRGLVPAGVAVNPQTERTREARRGDRSLRTTLVAVEEGYFDLFELATEAGTALRPPHMLEGARVCVLGRGIKRKLFDFEPAVGERVKLGSEWFNVIGVLADRSAGAASANKLVSRDVDLDIYIPLPTARIRFPRAFPQAELDQITITVPDRELLQPVARLVRRVLARRHHGVEDYALVLPEQLLQEEQKDQRLFNAVLAAIAGISLLVGGIGIMNIMLATVQERIREIGLRRAVGATARDVVAQFVAEAALLSVAGGLIGTVLGVTMAHSIDIFADFSAVVSPFSVVLAFGVSLAVGLVFGIYPAR
ncbi:MAG: hypothetical protein CME06_06425, partial [Gemmatimonadetes bacterium]|nr:hypothetical protein [Gemmatimonadota bacterium]